MLYINSEIRRWLSPASQDCCDSICFAWISKKDPNTPKPTKKKNEHKTIIINFRSLNNWIPFQTFRSSWKEHFQKYLSNWKHFTGTIMTGLDLCLMKTWTSIQLLKAFFTLLTFPVTSKRLRGNLYIFSITYLPLPPHWPPPLLLVKVSKENCCPEETGEVVQK